MKTFSTDCDILRYEPVLFGDLHLRVNVIASGTGGATSGTTFTASAANFITAGVEPGCVIYLSNAAGAISSFYEVISVNSQTQLTVSLLRADRNDVPKAPPQANEIAYRVCSYAPQANDVFLRLCDHFRITPGEAATITDSASLRRASVFLTMATVFAAIASRENFAQEYLDKSDRYTDLFIEAIDQCRFNVCLNGKKVTYSGCELRTERG